MRYRDYMRLCAHSYWQMMFADHGGNVSAVARAAGLNRSSFYRVLERMHLSLARLRDFRV